MGRLTVARVLALGALLASSVGSLACTNLPASGGASGGAASSGGNGNCAGSCSGGGDPGGTGGATIGAGGDACDEASCAGGSGGGGTATGGAGTSTGGVPVGACGSACENASAGSCSAPEVRVTEVDLGTTVLNNEAETTLEPLVLGAMPSGGARLGFMSDDGALHIAELDCQDALVGAPFALLAHDFEDIAADENGGVALLTRDARGGGTLNCGEPANLCDGGPDPAVPCHEMWMVRFDCAGNPAGRRL